MILKRERLYSLSKNGFNLGVSSHWYTMEDTIKVSQLIQKLQEILEKFGDLPVFRAEGLFSLEELQGSVTVQKFTSKYDKTEEVNIAIIE